MFVKLIIIMFTSLKVKVEVKMKVNKICVTQTKVITKTGTAFPNKGV